MPSKAGVSPWLHEEVASRMQERLDFIRLQPQQWVHWEPLSGGLAAHQALQQRYPKSEVWMRCAQPGHGETARKALAQPWWRVRSWRAPLLRWGMPPEHSAHMLWANMQLHASPQPQALLQEWHRTLAEDGFLMFSCFGPDTLRDLRLVYAQAGWPEPAHEFTDMHDWGDMLVQAGFAEPVMDMERITLTYASPDSLLTDLRAMGRNLHVHRFAGLRGKRWRAQLDAALLTLAQAQPGGRLSLGFEIVYGHALKPKPRMKMAAQTQIDLAQMRHMLRSGGGIAGKV
jgi:malonyl-CoA O-methyltransferase